MCGRPRAADRGPAQTVSWRTPCDRGPRCLAEPRPGLRGSQDRSRSQPASRPCRTDSAQLLKSKVRPLLPGLGTQGLSVRGTRGPVRASACLGGASAHCPRAGTC